MAVFALVGNQEANFTLSLENKLGLLTTEKNKAYIFRESLWHNSVVNPEREHVLRIDKLSWDSYVPILVTSLHTRDPVTTTNTTFHLFFLELMSYHEKLWTIHRGTSTEDDGIYDYSTTMEPIQSSNDRLVTNWCMKDIHWWRPIRKNIFLRMNISIMPQMIRSHQ